MNDNEELLGHVDWRFVPGAKIQSRDWAFGNLKGVVLGYDQHSGALIMSVENWPGINRQVISRPHWPSIRGRE
jgi:hypothetical protein